MIILHILQQELKLQGWEIFYDVGSKFLWVFVFAILTVANFDTFNSNEWLCPVR